MTGFWGQFAPGSWLAFSISVLRICGQATVFGMGLSGCLVTDQFTLEPQPQTSPVILAGDPSYPIGGIIKFDASTTNMLRIPLQIRDENLTEPLKLRWRTKTTAPVACPDLPVTGSGMLLRDALLVINAPEFDPGSCTRVDVVVSAVFTDCNKRKDPQYFDFPTTDDDNDVGLATFWVWEVGSDPISPSAAQKLVTTCTPQADYIQTTPEM
jgi:hypothetical protein